MTPHRLLFVDIDTQIDFMMPEGHLYVPQAEKIIPKLEALTNAAQHFNIPILASMDAHLPDDPEFDIFPAHCVQNTPGQKKIKQTLVSNSLKLPNERCDFELEPYQSVVVEKVVFDMFGNPNTEKILNTLNPTTCIVYGVATDYCVKAAALGLKSRGYSVHVVTDAIEAVTPEGGFKALQEMEEQGIMTTNLATVLEGIAT